MQGTDDAMISIADGLRWRPAGVAAVVLALAYAVADLVILMALTKKRLQKHNDFKKFSVVDCLVINICVADFLIGASQSISLLISGANVNNSEAACILTALVTSICSPVSFAILVLLAYSRYSLVKGKNDDGLAWKTVKRWMIGIWTFCIFFVGIGTFGGNIKPTVDGFLCREQFNPESATWMIGLAAGVVFVFVPSSAMFWLYYKVAQAARRDLIGDKLSAKVARMCFILNLVYVVTLFPVTVLDIITLATDRQPSVTARTASVLVAYFNFWANPICYVIFQRHFRKAVLDFIGLTRVMNYLGYSESNDSTKSASDHPSHATLRAQPSIRLDTSTVDRQTPDSASAVPHVSAVFPEVTDASQQSDDDSDSMPRASSSVESNVMHESNTQV